jgi:hypothetical protein
MVKKFDALRRLRQKVYRLRKVDSLEVSLTLHNDNIVIDLSCESHNLGMATLTQQHNTAAQSRHLIVGLTHTALKTCHNGTCGIDELNAKLLSKLIGTGRLTVRTYEQHTSSHRSYLVVRNGTQAQGLETLHLDTVMHNVAQRRHLANTLQGSLSLADSSHHAEAEARVLVNGNTHN